MNRKFTRFFAVIFCFLMFAASVSLTSFAASVGKVTALKITSYDTNFVSFKWSKVKNASGYKIELYDSSKKEWKAESTVKTNSYTDKSLKPGTVYKYRVKAYRTENKKTTYSAASDTLCALTKPESLKSFSLSAKSTSVKLSWKKVSSATGYRIYSYDYTEKKWVKKADTKELSFTDTKLTPCKSYKYRIKTYKTASGKTVFGDASESKTATTPPEQVKSLKLSKATQSSVGITWGKVKNADGYLVYTLSDSEWVLAKTTAENSYKKTKLSNGEKFTFKVAAYIKNGDKKICGEESSPLSVCTLPENVSGAMAATSAQNGIALKWNKASGADGYEVWRKAENSTKYVLAEDTKISCSFVDANLKSSGTYSYEIKAYTTAGKTRFYCEKSAFISHDYQQTKEPDNPYKELGKIGETGLIGYLYDVEGEYFYTASDPWQRNFGYNAVYDVTAPAVLIDFDTVRFKFEAENKDWLIQLWKGQYGMVFYGGEIGVYTKPKDRSYDHYDCASDDDRLKMGFVFYEKEWNGMKRVWNKKFERPYGTYWWCTGFVPGNSGLSYDDLKMEIHITLKDFEMLDGFTAALKKKGFEYQVNGLDVYLTYE
ncbi:MAG: DUF4474 domain-containing protein [Acutalibacteraceae bacterium]